MKRALLLCFALTGCAAGNTGAKLRLDHVSLPSISTAPAVPIILAPPCPATMRATVPPEPGLPDDASFPAPENAAAQAPTARYYEWLTRHEDYLHELQRRVQEGIGYCGAP